jgi:hypothetical protein
MLHSEIRAIFNMSESIGIQLTLERCEFALTEPTGYMSFRVRSNGLDMDCGILIFSGTNFYLQWKDFLRKVFLVMKNDETTPARRDMLEAVLLHLAQHIVESFREVRVFLQDGGAFISCSITSA